MSIVRSLQVSSLRLFADSSNNRVRSYKIVSTAYDTSRKNIEMGIFEGLGKGPTPAGGCCYRDIRLTYKILHVVVWSLAG